MGGIFSSFLSPESICSALSFVAGEAKYIWDLEDNLGALQSELDELIRARADLMTKVECAEQKPRTERTNQVKGWLENVQQKESKVGELQKTREQEIDRLCLGGFCSNDLVSSYNFGKRVVRLKQEVIELKDERVKIKNVAEMVRKAAAVELAVEKTVIGQESKLDQVWRCITGKENEEGIIGLHGQGGVGKSTLLKQINNNFLHQQHDFDVVIWVVVSREPKLEKIQEDIGKRIGFSDESWKKKTREDKASDISDILNKKKFVLLLDDIWQHIDLIVVGVPLQSLNTGSKIVFTTRSIGVCGEMNAGRAMIEVSTLAPDEARKLFVEVVGSWALESHQSIPKLAENLATECHGLPLVLKTVGQAMASERDPDEWERTINNLRTSTSKFSGMEEKVFSRLKYSYDHLSVELRSCLLYCCLFPEDFEISKTDLIAYWISEGFLDDLDAGYTAIRDLLRASLLEEGEEDSVKLHDLIRDMALWIACKIEKEEENFLVCTRGQEAPKIKDWNGVKRVSINDNRIARLSEIPNCHRLQTLLLDESKIEEISDGFFQSMPSLKVLSLRRLRPGIEIIPSGILCLVSLHHLDLSWIYVRKLPQELKALVNLRYLNLESAILQSRIPRQLICSFSNLQVLKMLEVRMPDGLVVSEEAVPLMKELLCLEHLNLITLTLRGSYPVRFFFESPTLVSITHLLSIKFCESPPLNFLPPMEHLKELNIYRSFIQDMKIEALQSGFQSLRRVSISNCSVVKDLTWLAFAPNLKIVDVNMCPDVEEIISVEKLGGDSEIMAEHNLFAQLECLSLIWLDNLTSICRDPLPFPQLKKIRVQSCRKYKKLQLNSSCAKDREFVIEGDTRWWEGLQWEDQANQNAFSTCYRNPYFNAKS